MITPNRLIGPLKNEVLSRNWTLSKDLDPSEKQRLIGVYLAYCKKCWRVMKPVGPNHVRIATNHHQIAKCQLDEIVNGAILYFIGGWHLKTSKRWGIPSLTEGYVRSRAAHGTTIDPNDLPQGFVDLFRKNLELQRIVKTYEK